MSWFKEERKRQQTERLEKFVNEILDDIIMESPKIIKYEYHENNQQFVFYSVNGKFDYYPMSDKILNRKKNKWSTGGLNKIFGYIGHKPKN